jgi:hypothetical protein
MSLFEWIVLKKGEAYLAEMGRSIPWTIASG